MSTALVTGASAGLGATFAKVLAGAGRDLVLVARDEARLDELADQLRGAHRVRVEVLVADLADEAGCTAVSEWISRTDRPIDLLVNNAGMGIYEPFGARELADEEALLDLNVRAVLRLTHAAVRAMRERGGGQVLNVSSVASLLPRGIGATYAASKAWVTTFSECLAQQLTGTGVQVSAVCPGFVHTEFHQRAGIGRDDVPDWMWLDAEQVVRAALAGLESGKPVTIPGAKWKAAMGVARTLPRPLLRRALRGRGL